MNNISKYLSWLTIPLAALVVVLFLKDQGEEYAFIDSIKAYNSSSLKDGLEKDLEDLTMRRKSLLDSLELNVKIEAQSLNAMNEPSEEDIKRFETRKSTFLMRKNQFEQEHSELKQKYSNQIWEDINEKAKEFAKKHKLKLLLGANGQGAILYGEEGIDHTTSFIEFLNAN